MATLTGTSAKNKLKGTAAADVISGLGGSDILLGMGGNDTLKGGTGNDTLDGGAGNDKLYGEAGNDRLISNAGSDRMDGGAGIDMADYSAANGGVGAGIDLTNAIASNNAAAGDTFFGIENVIGTKYNDVILGNNLNNTFTGGTGDDILAGFDGTDILYGGDGNDTFNPGNDAVGDAIFGGDGNDTVTYADNTDPQGVRVNLETNALGGGTSAQQDFYNSIENVVGSDTGWDGLTVAHGGTASGLGGTDSLSGSTIFGTLTTETLIGGAGNDNFTIHYGTGFDIFQDFTPFGGQTDLILYRTTEFSNALAGTLINVSNGVIASSAAQPQFIYDTIFHTLYFDQDGTGITASPSAVAFLPNFSGLMSASYLFGF